MSEHKAEISNVDAQVTVDFVITGVEPYDDHSDFGAVKWRPVSARAIVYEASYDRHERHVSGTVYVKGYRQKKGTGGDYVNSNEIRFWIDGMGQKNVPQYVKDIIAQAKAVYDQVKGVNR